MATNTSGINTEITVKGQKLETVTSFKYPGSAGTEAWDTVQDSTDDSSTDKVEQG